jgi:hypothetical protein
VGPTGLVPLSPVKDFLCLTCAPGKFRRETDAIDACEDCAPGLFAAAGAVECAQCEVGRVPNSWNYDTATPASSCVTCAPGNAPNPERTGCEACVGARFSGTGYSCDECTPAKTTIIDDEHTVINRAHSECIDTVIFGEFGEV